MAYLYKLKTLPPAGSYFTATERDRLKARGVPESHIRDLASRINARNGNTTCGRNTLDGYKRWLVSQGRVDEDGRPILPAHAKMIADVKDNPFATCEVSDAEGMDLLTGRARPAKPKAVKPETGPAKSDLIEAIKRMIEANTLKDIITARHAARDLIAA